MIRTAGRAGFERDVLGGPATFLCCFYADWCPHCVRYLPVFGRHPGRVGVEFVEVDISDEEDPLWDEYDIRVVPSLLLFRDGRLAARVDGVLGKGLGPGAVDSLLSSS